MPWWYCEIRPEVEMTGRSGFPFRCFEWSVVTAPNGELVERDLIAIGPPLSVQFTDFVDTHWTVDLSQIGTHNFGTKILWLRFIADVLLLTTALLLAKIGLQGTYRSVVTHSRMRRHCCPACGYPTGNTTCPECGSPLQHQTVPPIEDPQVT